MERTFAIVKPDSFSKKVVGKIISSFEDNEFKIVGCKFIKMTEKIAGDFYKEHFGKSFYEELVNFMTSNPVIVLVLEREDAIMKMREVVGKTNPKEAASGTVRNLYGTNTGFNAVHASDSPNSAKREISLFFKAEEIVSWKTKEYK